MLEMRSLVIPVACALLSAVVLKISGRAGRFFLPCSLMLAAFLAVIAVNEQAATPQLAQNGAGSE